MSTVAPMAVSMLKTGYEQLEVTPWVSFQVDEGLKEKVRWEGKEVVVSLKKLSMEEREDAVNQPHEPVGIPNNKGQLLRKELKKDRKDRGLDVTHGILRISP